MEYQQLNKLFGNIDLHLLDQILKGRFNPEMRLLDAGCGEGRNLQYFMAQGYAVFGIDQEPLAIKMTQMQAGRAYKPNFMVAAIEDHPFPSGFFDAILCVNVLHHARNANHFHNMLEALINMLASKGVLFIRLETVFLRRHLGQNKQSGKGCRFDYNVVTPWLKHHRLESLAPIKQEIVENSADLLTLVAQKVG